MPATLDVITQAKNIQAELNCPQGTLAFLAGISGSRMSKYLAGHLTIGGQDELNLRLAIENLRRLCELCEPIPVDFSRVGKVKQCVGLMESGSLKVMTVDLNPEL
jgi:hypothetical protein